MSCDIKSYLKEKGSLVEKNLRQFIPENLYQPIYDAMEYSLMAGGKRVRPILSFAGFEACGGIKGDIMPMAVALEMIHTFSLIHDDLPAMDDDDLRRGKPTNHKVYGEDLAILAGDGLVSLAFEVLTHLEERGFESSKTIRVIREIAHATGAPGMVGGQAIDVNSEGEDISLDELKRLHRLKTGALIATSVKCGAILACDDEVKIKQMEDYGFLIGLAFQIADDILDIEGGEDLGKDIGSDLEKNKATYPRFLGLDGAKKEAIHVRDQALEVLKDYDEKADPLRALAHYIIERRN